MLTLAPYVLASQGTMLAGRAGVFNVSQEGIMLVGASVGFLGAYLSGGNLLLGMVLAIIVGGFFGLALAYFTTTLKIDQFVIGLSLFFIGLALSTLLYRLAIGVTLTPPLIPTLREIPVPGFSRIPVLGEVFFKQNALVYGAVLLSLALDLFLYYTAPGMALRAVGENPMAADSLGVNVLLTRYLTTVVGSMLIGLAGAYLPMVYTATFTEGMVRGRGWLSIALTFFGGWSPLLILLGALFFAGIEVLAFRVQVTGVGIPYQFILMLPYLATIAVMMPTFRRLQVPAFLGRNYDRERRVLL
jgi:simple sugar transport system permease protein